MVSEKEEETDAPNVEGEDDTQIEEASDVTFLN